MHDRTFSFDTKGFIFSIKCIAIFVVLFMGTKFGSGYISTSFVAAQDIPTDAPTPTISENQSTPVVMNTASASEGLAPLTISPSNLQWSLATASANWQPRDSAVSFTFEDKIWTMGGLNGNTEVRTDHEDHKVLYWNAPHFNDIWNTDDGVTWNLVTKHASWPTRRSMSVAYFKGRLIMLGGWSEKDGYNNDIWESTDGKDWDKIVAHAAWPAREGQTLEVFQDKLWLIGGVNYDKRIVMNDVWYSNDGSEWHQVTAPIPWSGRWDHDTEVYKDKIFLTAGMNISGDTFKDVWSSEDGSTWELVTDNPPWQSRQGHILIDYKDTLWTIGRLNDSKDKGVNDTWFTTDGKNWEKTDTDPPWTGREDHSVLLFKDALYVFGGMDADWSWKNDVWFSTLNNSYAELSEVPNTQSPSTKTPENKSPISALSYVSIYVTPDGTQTIITEKDKDEERPIASITKLMVALVASEKYAPEDIIIMPPEALSLKGSSNMYQPKEKFDFSTALQALLVGSHNEMAAAIAHNSNDFLETMNGTATSLGLSNTAFVNTTGLDPRSNTATVNHSTATDIVALLKYIHKVQPEILSLTTNKEFKMYDSSGTFVSDVHTTDKLLGDDSLPFRIIGGKTGETPRAKQNLALVTEAPCGGTLYSVILGSSDSFGDMRSLLTYGKDSQELVCR